MMSILIGWEISCYVTQRERDWSGHQYVCFILMVDDDMPSKSMIDICLCTVTFPLLTCAMSAEFFSIFLFFLNAARVLHLSAPNNSIIQMSHYIRDADPVDEKSPHFLLLSFPIFSLVKTRRAGIKSNAQSKMDERNK